MFVLCLLLVCYFVIQTTFYPSPSCLRGANPHAAADDTVVHEYAERYLYSLNKGIEKEIGVAADELFAFMFITGITRFRHNGKTFVLRQQMLA
jgi:hypothetical protein